MTAVWGQGLRTEEKAQKVIELMKTWGVEDLVPSADATPEDTLNGIFRWLLEAMAYGEPNRERDRVLVFYDNGRRDGKAVWSSAACRPQAFLALLMMARGIDENLLASRAENPSFSEPPKE